MSDYELLMIIFTSTGIAVVILLDYISSIKK